ncbi:MAG: hypothetical protein QOJ60_2615 [Actinomycetota bacterium]|nr:hypothetical protein [Actinomycetota bacterium]
MSTPTPHQWRALGRRLSNWGRWGADDQIGTANLITPERVVAAAAAVRRGDVFDLGIPLDETGPQTGAGGRNNPVRLMSAIDQVHTPGAAMHFNDDQVFMPLQAGTQWDGLSHVFYDGRMYNDTSVDQVSAHGAARLGIETLSNGIVGRGVLIDVAACRGVGWLASGEVIEADELDAVLAAQGTRLSPGDIVLVRTGWRRKYLTDGDKSGFLDTEPGIGLSCCQWLKDHDVAAIASDNWAVEAIPGEVADEVFPVHMVAIRDMGMVIGEMFDLESLASDCASDGVFEFMLCAPVLKFTGGTGTPLNPLAIK